MGPVFVRVPILASGFPRVSRDEPPGMDGGSVFPA